jgi:hypothetical protein
MKDLRRGTLIGLQTVWSSGRGRLKEQSSGQENIKLGEKESDGLFIFLTVHGGSGKKKFSLN